MTISVRVDCKIQTADSVDNQRKSRLCSLDLLNVHCFPPRKNSKVMRSKLDSEAISV